MKDRFKKQDLWKIYALFIRSYMQKNLITVEDVAATSGVSKMSLQKFIILESRLGLSSFLSLVTALDLKIIFQSNKDQESFDVFSESNLNITEIELPPKRLRIEKYLDLHGEKLPVFVNEGKYYFGFIDLCEVSKLNYSVEISKVKRNIDLEIEISSAIILYDDKTIRELFVIPVDCFDLWVSTLNLGPYSIRNDAKKVFNLILLELEK